MGLTINDQNMAFLIEATAPEIGLPGNNMRGGLSVLGAQVAFHNNTLKEASRRCILVAEGKFASLKRTLCSKTPLHRRVHMCAAESIL